METTFRKLYRSQTDRWIAGVCGGVAHYLNVDPIVVRILAIVCGLLPVYLVMWILVPNEPRV